MCAESALVLIILRVPRWSFVSMAMSPAVGCWWNVLFLQHVDFVDVGFPVMGLVSIRKDLLKDVISVHTLCATWPWVSVHCDPQYYGELPPASGG